MSEDPFLRSVDPEADRRRPERLAHYLPSRKSLGLVRAVLGLSEPATMAIAAYGSGKSLAAAIAACLIENEAEHASPLAELRVKIAAVDEELGAALEATNERRGRALILSGHVLDLQASLAVAAGVEASGTLKAMLDRIAEACAERGENRLALIWDEFGRHLGGLAASGRSDELHALQEIAEWATRAERPRATLTLLMHQSLASHAATLSEAARSAWKKVEGRFATLRFVEDGPEVYRMLAQAAGDGPQPPLPGDEDLAAARVALGHGWFPAFASPEDLAPLLACAGRLTPAALHLLPLLAGRLAQNERTAFGVLNGLPLGTRHGLGSLYDRFAEAMRTDTGLGGTHRRHVEAEEALSLAETDAEREVLKSACLLRLGAGAEPKRLTLAALTDAAAGGRFSRDEARAAVAGLLARKLLLHRERVDDVSIWQGGDADVAGRAAELRARLKPTIDVPAALEAASPAPHQLPLRHNAQNAITRYFEGRYAGAEALLARGDRHPALTPCSGDGRIVYALAETNDAIEGLSTLAREGLAGRGDLVLAVPRRPLSLADLVAEAQALRELKGDEALLADDPLAGKELDELAAVAAERLTDALDRLINPALGAVAWWSGGRDLGVDAGTAPGEALSKLADARFARTPCLRNEALVRRKASKAMVNARKRALIGVLERDDRPAFGLEGATTPEASICRALLTATGLHVDGEPRWAAPGEVDDPALAEVWGLIRAFFAEPAELPKAPTDLLNALKAPPYGLRDGVLPMLIGAGYRAFARCVALREDEIYVADVLPSTIEALCAESGRFELEVRALDDGTAACLQALLCGFGGGADERDLIRGCFDAITAWKAALPLAAMTTRDLSADALALQRALKTEADPMDLLLRALPSLAQRPRLDQEAVAHVLRVQGELEAVVGRFAERAAAVASRAFHVRPNGHAGLLERAAAWARCVAGAANALNPAEAGLVKAAAAADSGRFTEDTFVRSLSTRLLGKDLRDWTDGTEREFEAALRRSVEAVERALVHGDGLPAEAVPLVGGRLEELTRKLSAAIGAEDTKIILNNLMNELSA